MKWFDSHCHLDLPEFGEAAPAVWQRARAKGVAHAVIPGVEPARWAQTYALANTLPGVSWAAGLHPWWVAGYLRSDAGDDTRAASLQSREAATITPDALAEQLHYFLTGQARGPVAVGECGLDGSIELPVSDQLVWLTVQLEVAQQLSLPVILHAHKAHGELLAELKNFPGARGVVHGFAGSVELANQYLRKGWLLGIGGVVTYERARKTRNTLAQLPPGSFLLETDAPAMPVAGGQGQRNEPAQLIAIAECVAALRGESLAALHDHTQAAAKSLFGAAAFGD